MIYEYKCTNCNCSVEIKRDLKTLKDNIACDECLSPMTRIYSVPNISFKGSGFYVNDYKEGEK